MNSEYFVDKCYEGLKRRGLDNKPEYKKRLDHEISIIHSGGLEDFFLNTAYIVLKIKKEGMMVGNGRGCLSSDSLIFTSNGFKKIKDVNTHDMVLSDDGNFHEVLSLQKYPNNDKMLNIKTFNDTFEGLKLTPDHKVLSCGPNYTSKYVKAVENNWKSIDKIKKFSDIIEAPKWVEAKDLNIDDLLVLPKQKFSDDQKFIDLAKYSDLWVDVQDNSIIEYTVINFSGRQQKVDITKEPILEEQKEKTNKQVINRYIPIDYDLGYFLGVFSGDGWLVRNARTAVGLCCNTSEDDENYIPKIINSIGIRSYYKNKHNDKEVVQYTFRSRVFVNLLKSLVPDYNYTSQTKELYGYLLSNNTSFLRGLVDGIIKSDGYVEKNRVKVTTSSIKLAEQLRYVLFKLNVPNSIIKEERVETRPEFLGACGLYYNIQFSKQALYEQKYNARFKEDKDNIYLRIRDIKECPAEKYVYDLHIKDSHNFLTQSYIVHNSAAGSLVAYCLGITEIDPLEYGLIFERFLNPTRINSIASADIDTDVSRRDRQKILEMVKDEFGEDKTFQIINRLKWTEKTAIKDIGRVIGLDFQYLNKMTRLISDDQKAEDVPDVAAFLEKHPFIRDNYKKLVGLIKTYGVHAGGVITLDNSVEAYDSIVRVNGVKCLDNDGKTTDSLGFLKNDLLGLNTLDIISDTIDLLPDVNLPKEYNDPEVFETINKSTLGIFQLEGAGATNVCERLQPSSFEELCAVVALCRPGSMDSGDTDRYIARKHGEEVIYDHPLLEPILKQNYGCIIYQEDAMRIVTDFAGMSNTDADIIRKGIGKKIQAVFDEYHPKFIAACNNKCIDINIAETVWEKMEASASYSFNKSHCVAYTSLSYICGWLKTHHPIEFYLAILNNTEDEDKRMKVYAEIKETNNAIANPDINESKAFTVESGDKIYLSFNLIKDVGQAAIKNILAGQPYRSYDDFCNRCKVNKRVKKALIEAGAFDCFEIPRYELYNTLTGEDSVWDEKETLFREFNRIKINPNGNILDLFDLNELGIVKEISSIKDLESNTEEYRDFYIKVLSSDFKLKEDYAHASVTDGFNSIGLFVTKEFIPRYADELNEIGNPLICHVHGRDGKYTLLSLINLQDIEKHSTEYKFYVGETNKTLVKLQRTNPDVNVGVVSNVRYFTSKAGNRCCFYDIFVSEKIILEDRILCNAPDVKMTDGSYIFFLMGNNEVFPQIFEVR